jgi:hypothetical protein
MHFFTLDLCQTCGQDNPSELNSLKMLLLEPIAKLAYLMFSSKVQKPSFRRKPEARSQKPEAPKFTGFRVKHGMTKRGKIDF